MKYILTMIMCSVMEGQTTCIPPFTFDTRYNDAYDCMVDGYNKSSEIILELGREDVNEYNIYIKFGCTPVAAKATSV